MIAINLYWRIGIFQKWVLCTFLAFLLTTQVIIPIVLQVLGKLIANVNGPFSLRAKDISMCEQNRTIFGLVHMECPILSCNKFWSKNWFFAVADPGFSREERQLQRWEVKCYHLANFFPKVVWKWKKLDHGPWHPAPWIRQYFAQSTISCIFMIAFYFLTDVVEE